LPLHKSFAMRNERNGNVAIHEHLLGSASEEDLESGRVSIVPTRCQHDDNIEVAEDGADKTESYKPEESKRDLWQKSNIELPRCGICWDVLRLKPKVKRVILYTPQHAQIVNDIFRDDGGRGGRLGPASEGGVGYAPEHESHQKQKPHQDQCKDKESATAQVVVENAEGSSDGNDARVKENEPAEEEKTVEDGRGVAVLMPGQCGHMFCRECVAGWLKANINNGKIHLRCPQSVVIEDDDDSDGGITKNKPWCSRAPPLPLDAIMGLLEEVQVFLKLIAYFSLRRFRYLVNSNRLISSRLANLYPVFH